MNKFWIRKGKFKFLALVMVMMLAVGSIAYGAPGSLTAVTSGALASATADQEIMKGVDAHRVIEHMQYLSEQLSTRVAGTVEELKAAEYIKGQFAELGYQVELQGFDINNVVPHLYLDSGGNKEVRANAASGSGFTDPQGITGNIVDCGLGQDIAAFPEKVKGNIALIQRGVVTFTEKVKNAVQAGAIGVILYDNAEGLITPTLTPYESSIPVVSISRNDGETVKQGGMVGTIMAELKTQSQNVVAKRLPHKSDGKPGIVYVTAHYDTAPLAPGANDNTSGTAALLELARVLKAYPIDKEIRFIACGAEEIGLKGSEYYVSQLTDDEITRSIGNFNMDMIATSFDKCNILYADTVDGQANLVSDTAIASGARLGKDLLAVNYGRSSDHAPFGDFGIPAACFIWGDAKGKLEPWYHTPDDNIAINFSLAKLETACDIIGAAIYEVLDKPTPSFDRNPLGNQVVMRQFGKIE